MSPFLLPLALVASLLAQDATVSYDQGDAPRMDGQGAVRYLSGGVGLDARQEIALAGAAFPLKVVLATTPGRRYLAGVEVTVRRQDGTAILQIRNAGPWLFLDLPPGCYLVEGSRRSGQTARSGLVTVGVGPQVQLPLLFPDTPQPQG